MKKILSVLIATIMAFSAMSVTSVVALAKTVESPTADVHFKPAKPIINEGGNVTVKQDPNDEYRLTITIDPDSEFTLDDWGIPGTEGVDYTIISESDTVLVIHVINSDLFEEEGISPTYIDESGNKGGNGTNKDDSNKSPQTGEAGLVASATTLVLGVAVLSAIKSKKKDVE